MISENYALSQSAKEAYKTYISGYDSHSMKDVFNVHRLDLKVTKSAVYMTITKCHQMANTNWFLQSDLNVAILGKPEIFVFLQEIAASFGFSSPPKVALKIDQRGGGGYKSKREPVNKFNRARGGRTDGKRKFERY